MQQIEVGVEVAVKKSCRSSGMHPVTGYNRIKVGLIIIFDIYCFVVKFAREMRVYSTPLG